MSKIKVIIPNAGMSSSTLKERERMLKAVAREDTEISVDCIKGGPESLESEYDSLMASRYILEEVKIAENSGFDAIIIYCGGDPALAAAREIVNIPVIGPGEAEINCRISFIPGETEENVKKEVGNAINEVTKKDNWLNKNKPIIEWYGWHGEPWEEEKDKEMIIEFKKVAEYVLKNKVKYVGKTAGMDNRFAKYFNTVVLAFGPNGNNMHGMNEYVEKNLF